MSYVLVIAKEMWKKGEIPFTEFLTVRESCNDKQNRTAAARAIVMRWLGVRKVLFSDDIETFHKYAERKNLPKILHKNCVVIADDFEGYVQYGLEMFKKNEKVSKQSILLAVANLELLKKKEKTMGLIQQEILELRQLIQEIRKDEIPLEKVDKMVSVYSQINKRTAQLLQIESMNIKAGGREKSWRRMNELNVVSDGDAIEVFGQPCLKCPAQGDKLIGRDECLDYSGQERHLDVCQNCQQFGKTRRALLPT